MRTGALDLLEAELAGRIEQRELLDLLVRREQVALDAIGEEGERALALGAGGDVLALRRQALGDPRRQRLPLDRIDAHRDAGAVERGEPGARLLRAVEPRQLHQRDDVAAAACDRDLAVALQRLRAVLAGLARRNADLDQLAVGEQAQRLRRAEQAAPVEVRAGDGVHLALAAAGGARGGADRVGGLLGEQRLVAPHRVDRAQVALQVVGESVGVDLHQRAASDESHRGEPAQHLRDDVALHRAVEERLLLLLGERGVLGVGERAALQRSRSRRSGPCPTALRTRKLKRRRSSNSRIWLAEVWATTTFSRASDERLQDDLRLARALDDARRRARLELAAQLGGERRARREARPAGSS